MQFARILFASAVLGGAAFVSAQQVGQPELRIDSANRTLSVTGEGEVTAEPEIAILHVGFETQPGDPKDVYADGARTSNAIIGALKQAGVAEDAIRSESQYLGRDFSNPKQRKYKLIQQWTVRAPAARAAEILDVAVTAGATSSGEIEWTVKDEHALEEQALDKAAARVKSQAAILAKGMGVQLGSLIYVSNQLSAPRFAMRAMAMPMAKTADNAQPLSIEPQKVSRQASVYAVFAIQ